MPFTAACSPSGVPREDARFVLPYCFRSNFYMTLNAREFIHMVRAMLYGRGSRWAELRALGASLKEQFERVYPGMVGEGAAAPRTRPSRSTDVSAGQGRCRAARACSQNQTAVSCWTWRRSLREAETNRSLF